MWPFLLLGAGALFLFMKSDGDSSSMFVVIDGMQRLNPSYGADMSEGEKRALENALVDYLGHVQIGAPVKETTGPLAGLVKLPTTYGPPLTPAMMAANAANIEKGKQMTGLEEPWGLGLISDIKAIMSGQKLANSAQYFLSEADARRLAAPGSAYFAVPPT